MTDKNMIAPDSRSRQQPAVSAVPSRKVVRHGRAGRIIGTVVAVVAIAVIVNSVARNPNFEWHIVGRYLLSAPIIAGLWVTVWVSTIVFLLAFVLGLPLALMRMSQTPLLGAISWTYIWIFRSAPLLVQLLFWYNIAAVYPNISIGIPFGEDIAALFGYLGLGALRWEFYSTPSNTLISPILAAILGLALHEAAYAAEIIRGGIEGVDEGQVEAARSLGISRTRIVLRIVLPQAMRTIVPTAGSLFINILKATSLISVISVADLLHSAQIIYNRTFEVIPLLMVATVWYLILCAILSIGQHYVERYFAKGSKRVSPQVGAIPGQSTP